MSNNQPNIIFIMAEQLAASTLNCYGGSVASSPLEGKSFVTKSLDGDTWNEVTVESHESHVRGIVFSDNWHFNIFNDENSGGEMPASQ